MIFEIINLDLLNLINIKIINIIKYIMNRLVNNNKKC